MRRVVFAVALAVAAVALAQSATYTRICLPSTIQESGLYRELPDGGWQVTCCGEAKAADGGLMQWHFGACETRENGTLAGARNACRTAWVAKRCN